MPVLVSEISANVKTDEKAVIGIALKRIPVAREDIVKAEIYKTSLDARKRDNIHFVHTVYVQLSSQEKEKELCDKYPALKYMENSRLNPVISKNKKDGRVVIAGFGPAGMFCGLVLAEYGYKPIIVERGEKVEDRIQKVSSFWNGGELDTDSNVQFGEGGAGTFSDGKLTTRIKDPLCRYILERFVEFDAPEEILFKAKAHVGTDKLRNVVKNISERILTLGGEIKFSTKLEDVSIKDNEVKLITAGGEEISSSAIVLAVGHSARDTFEMLVDKGVFIEPKAFSVGARIEHKQSDVDFSLYGKQVGNPYLPKGEYQLSYRDREGRGVYTFCMCPGGYVVPAASEAGGVVTNGMSEFARDGENANSAVVVSVTPKDFGNNPLDGVNFAREIEQKAYAKTKGSYKAPATSVKRFMRYDKSISKVMPSYSRGVEFCGLDGIFPEKITNTMKVGIRYFGGKMSCFDDGGAILTGPETRTSSPVKITRNENGTSITATNLYPCGEGAGYAGGIMSSAVDGVKIALKIMESIAPQ
ncbi:MAG: hypothetical protein GX896_03705 [Clostridiales bacterium]|nr:hypothetical protein [Clostridiales bacterium]